MNKYNLEYLTWFDFEGLSRDIVEVRESLRLEGFTLGIDGGTDFRHMYDKKRSLVVQCKHYKTYSSLLRNLRKEIVKVKRLDPSRYVLVTSVDMTPGQKDKILELFSPYILVSGDVICGNDIEQDLDKNSFLLKKNHKLWLTSSRVLELILQKKIIGRSNQLEIDIKQKARLYVETDSVSRSIEVLKKYNYAIIAGAPGIGKTTLAQVLALYYAKDGYELAYVTNIEEAEEVMDESEGQPPRFIYYDDFLGTNLLKSAPYRNEDKRLVNLFSRVRASKKTTLIMTTREYILRQAKNDYEALDKANIDLAKVVIEISKYSPFQKAQILYNHLYYSKLSKAFLKNIARNKNYERIIYHRSYNPRLIESMTSAESILGASARTFTDDFVALLDDPSAVWERAFESHITIGSRFLLYALYISPSKILLEDLEKNLFQLLKVHGSKTGAQSVALEFMASIKELDGTFIETTSSEGRSFISFANPSMIDFLTSYINKDQAMKEILFFAAAHLDSILERFSLSDKKHAVYINVQLHESFINRLIEYFDEYEDVDTIDALLTLKQLNRIDKTCEVYSSQKLSNFMADKLIKVELPISYTDYDLLTYLRLLEKFGLSSIDIARSIISHVIHNVQDVEDLKKITTLNLYYEEELFDVALMNTIDLPQLFSETVDDYSQNLAEFDVGELESLLEEIDEVENSMGYDLGAEKEAIARAMAEKNAMGDDPPTIDTGTMTAPINDIDNLFQTLTV